MVTQRTKHSLTWIGVALFLIAILSATVIYLPQLTQRAAIVGTGQVLSGGQTACPGQSGTFDYLSPPAGCLNIGQKIEVKLTDAYSAAALSGWTCQLMSNGGPVNQNPAGYIYETSANTGSNGLCSGFAGVYYPGQALIVKVCEQTTTCTSSSYAQQVTVYYRALPGPQGLPGGTVPFWPGTQSPTTTPTLSLNMPVVRTAGDAAGSNTPYAFTFVLANGTRIATASTCWLNQAAGTNTCFLGAGVKKPSFTFTISNTYTVSTFPNGAGYVSFTQTDVPANGLLTNVLSLEIKQTVGSNPIPVMLAGQTGPFGSSPTATKQGSVPDVFYMTGDLSDKLVKVVDASGTVQKSGVFTETFAVDATAMSTTNDAASLTFNLYIYFSITWFSTYSGTFNTEAVTQMSQFVLTLKSP